MNYFFSKTVDTDFNQTREKLDGLLKEQGFGIITEIDMQEILKKKLNVNFKRYKILGACNPDFAYKALLTEDKIGLMLPCNLIIQESKNGKTEVTAIDPVASMTAVNNDKLKEISFLISRRLQSVILSL